MPPVLENVWTLSHFLFGLTYALVASLIFIFLLLWLFRPTIKIGHQIATHVDDKGKKCFRFKFYNCSIFAGHDIIVNLRSLESTPASPEGFDVLVTNIELTSPKSPYLPRWRSQNYSKKKSFAPHCLQIKTYEDIHAILSDKNKSLQLRIILKHELTGLSRNFIANYSKAHTIVNGEFEFGNTFDIK